MDSEPAAAVLVANGDTAPVRLDELTSNRGPEPRPGMARRTCRIAAERDVEHAREVRLGDAASRVDHRDVGPVMVSAGLDGHSAVARRVANRVLEDVA